MSPNCNTQRVKVLNFEGAYPTVDSGPILIEPLASGFGHCEAGWLFRHASNRALVDQSVERIGQDAVGQAGSGCRLKILKRNTRRPMLGR